jgi:hypothetical protein
MPDSDCEVKGRGAGKPHNPYEDDIQVVLVFKLEPAVLNTLNLGMWLGHGGLWVQNVREEADADNEALVKSNAT